MLTHHERTYALFAREIETWLTQHGQPQLMANVRDMLTLDASFSPRVGPTRTEHHDFAFDANAVMDTLEAMELPDDAMLEQRPTTVAVFIPGGVGDIIKDPDGGVWIHSERADSDAGTHNVPANAVGIPLTDVTPAAEIVQVALA
jgi:hypothetical protein